MPTCDNCNKSAAAKCSRCGLARYCSKECQVSHWPKHRLECTDVQHMRAFLRLRDLIKGNLLLMAAYHLPTGGEVVIRIDERVIDFFSNSSIHMAHLSIGEELPGQYKAVFRFSDMKITLPLEDPPAKIKEKYPAPDKNWSILFEL